jgi:hypothetical protein
MTNIAFIVGFNFQRPSGGKTSAKFRQKAGLRTLENLKIGVISVIKHKFVEKQVKICSSPFRRHLW